MRYAVLGDIHGNLEAFESVLEYLSNEHIDKYLVLGDIVGYGANPRECIDLTKKIATCVTAGNHDFASTEKLSAEFFNVYARRAAQWTHQNLSQDDIDYLNSLPLVDYFDNVTLVHATLHAPELFEYIQTSYDAHLTLDKMNTQLCFIGHSHIPVIFIKKKLVVFSVEPLIKLEPNTKYIINVGSVGQPRDDNPDAAFAIYDTDKKEVEIKRVKYDVDTATKKIINAGLPEILAERLRYGK